MGKGKHKGIGHRRKKGEWINISNARARVMAGTRYKTVEECLKLPRKVRKFGNVTYPKGVI